MSFGEDIPLKEFKGLESAMSSASAAEFELPREAGTFTFKGQFKNDKGAGEFKFVSDPQFAKNMETLGYKKLAFGESHVLVGIVKGLGSADFLVRDARVD